MAVGKIDGWRGLVNMRDWNDTQTCAVCCCGSDGTHTEETHSWIYGIDINSHKADIDK